MTNDNNNHCQIRNNHSITMIDESHEQQRQGNWYLFKKKRKIWILFLDDDDDHHIDYSNDEILNILLKKRDELLISFRWDWMFLLNVNIFFLSYS